MRPSRVLVVLAAVAAAVALALRERRNPSACPYSQRWLVEAPRPFLSRARLMEVLEPAERERLLEVGPGTGYYSLDVAERPGERGKLELFDVQRQMLDHAMRAAEARGLSNVTAWEGDARELLFEPDRFDGAFLVTVLGEIPDQDAALRELARVVKPGGRVVFGEMALDPHMVGFGSLRRRAEAAGLEYERRAGGALGYFARFRVPEAAAG
jgi:ubiquinone/menaquinone biosynthesis C-methylase UbiE